MPNFEILEYSDNYSEIVKDIRDTQFTDGVNTVFDCSIETMQLYQDNIVELVLRYRLQSYPDQLIDKYTFYSQQRYVLKDINGAFFADPWNGNTIDLFANIYVDGHKQFTNEFKNKLVDSAIDFNKNEPIVDDENIKRIASEILQFYVHKMNNQ